MIDTERLLIVEAVQSEIDTIMEIESHKDNRNFIWIGTYEEHNAEIDDKNHLLLVFKRKKENDNES